LREEDTGSAVGSLKVGEFTRVEVIAELGEEEFKAREEGIPGKARARSVVREFSAFTDWAMVRAEALLVT